MLFTPAGTALLGFWTDNRARFGGGSGFRNDYLASIGLALS